MVLLRETPQEFAAITEKFVSSLPAKKTQWIHEILDEKKEQDRVLVSSNNFVAVMQPSNRKQEQQAAAICQNSQISIAAAAITACFISEREIAASAGWRPEWRVSRLNWATKLIEISRRVFQSTKVG